MYIHWTGALFSCSEVEDLCLVPPHLIVWWQMMSHTFVIAVFPPKS
jgi:hypothetical protein